MKAYISGKITGIESTAAAIFESAEKHLVSGGFKVTNPMKLNHDHDLSWCSYMKEDIKAMCDCTHIYMLHNWKESKGAQIEFEIALHIGLTVMYQQNP